MVATEALESHIATSEAEVAQMKEGIVGKRDLLRIWRKALATFNPKRVASKKRAVGNPRKAVASGAFGDGIARKPNLATTSLALARTDW